MGIDPDLSHAFFVCCVRLLVHSICFLAFVCVITMNKECKLRSLSDLDERLGEVRSPFDAAVPDVLNE